MAPAIKPVPLNPQTLEAFEAYVLEAERGMEQSLQETVFLWSQQQAERAQKVDEGQIVAQFWSGGGPAKVPSGLIHDWIGAAFIPDSTIPAIFAVIQNYDNHKNIYRPEVIDSKLLRREGDDFQIYLRLLKKKVITVVLDTEHNVQYRLINNTRWVCRSDTTRISEVENAGSPREQILQPDTGYGYLWRLYSYWRFEERDAGVAVECRAISLTRDVPFGLGWAIEPIIQKLPRESLVNTLECTRQALAARSR